MRGRSLTSEFAYEPGLEDTAETVLGVTRDGLTQLRRYWPAPEARAAALIVHGIGEHCGRYEHVARQMNASGISVVGYDHRGHGESGGRRGHLGSWDQYLDDVEDQLASMRELGLPTTLLGHSMGGLVVTSYGLSGRPQPGNVVLSAPALRIDAKQWLQTPLLLLSKLTNKPSMDLGLDKAALSTDPRVGDAYAADPLVGSKASLGLLGAMVEATRSVADNLRSWDHDTLIVHGLDDPIVLPDASAPLGERPGVDRRTYQDGRHELFNEPWGPDVVGEVIDWIHGTRA